MAELLSVIIPTFNPDERRLERTLQALRQQTLPIGEWELVIVDNNSTKIVKPILDWHPNHTIVKQPKPGLTYARLKGFETAKGNILVMVDDDNVLHPDYLKHSVDILERNPQLGVIGGKTLPDFESTPQVWIKAFYGSLALRDLGEKPLISKWSFVYPDAAPIGAGMVIRRKALGHYIDKITHQESPVADRTGSSLGSGGDNDLVLEIIKNGWHAGYFPGLSLVHIIPVERMEVSYLARLNHETNRSWVRLLESHQINPWKKVPAWTVPLRKLKAWFTYKAWRGEKNYINWRGACGTYEGLSDK